MKRSLLQDGRGRRGRARGGRLGRFVVEFLEARSLLSGVHHPPVKSTAVLAPPRPQPTYPPYTISAQVGPVSDPAGSGYVFQPNILVQGVAAPFSTVWLAQGSHGYFSQVAHSDSSGIYGFIVPISHGVNEIRTFAETPPFNTAFPQDYSAVTTIHATFANPIIAWDAIALRAIRNLNLTDAEAARDLAILHAAQYDAVAAVEFPNAAYQVHASAPAGSSAVAAAAAAADTVLESLFPTQAGAFVSAMTATKLGLPVGSATDNGLALGRQVAQATLTNRANDRSNLAVTYTLGPAPGIFRPTAPGFAPAADPQWGLVSPFVIANGAQFRPPAPPAIGGRAYDTALAQVANLGVLTSKSRTKDQSNAALFWDDGVNSFTNPGHWNAIAEGLAVKRGGSLAQDARLFAQLDFAQADAAIAALDAKYTYDTWRPISAIETTTDPSWVPLLKTPATPSYVSSHAAYAAAASDVLASAFGPRAGFTDALYSSVGLTRTFSSVVAAATEDGQSRIWGGVGTSADVQAGSTLGDQVGKYVLGHFPKGR